MVGFVFGGDDRSAVVLRDLMADPELPGRLISGVDACVLVFFKGCQFLHRDDDAVALDAELCKESVEPLLIWPRPVSMLCFRLPIAVAGRDDFMYSLMWVEIFLALLGDRRRSVGLTGFWPF